MRPQSSMSAARAALIVFLSSQGNRRPSGTRSRAALGSSLFAAIFAAPGSDLSTSPNPISSLSDPKSRKNAHQTRSYKPYCGPNELPGTRSVDSPSGVAPPKRPRTLNRLQPGRRSCRCERPGQWRFRGASRNSEHQLQTIKRLNQLVIIVVVKKRETFLLEGAAGTKFPSIYRKHLLELVGRH